MSTVLSCASDVAGCCCCCPSETSATVDAVDFFEDVDEVDSIWARTWPVAKMSIIMSSIRIFGVIAEMDVINRPVSKPSKEVR